MDIASSVATVFVAAHFAPVLAVFAGVLTCLAQGNIAAKSIESIARQPEAKGSINGAMIISLGMAETNGIYGFIVAMILLFLNPFTSLFLDYMRSIQHLAG